MSNTVKVPAEIYSRVSGYYRPVNQWNRGKQEEFSCRTSLTVKNETTLLSSEISIGATS